MNSALSDDIIVAPATASGGALTIIRVSGQGAIELIDTIFKGVRGTTLSESKGYTLHYGYIVDDQEIIDDVMVSLFRAPHSYTSEDGVEISCHGSSYITSRIIELIINHGGRMATAGEFTVRAFMAGRLDLSQAEAVGDMIASTNATTHRLASNQMRGGYSSKLMTLRDELIHIGALLTLELDFSEEDVEFANRDELRRLIDMLLEETKTLCESFRLGNALKEGVNVAIVGAPNGGKSTLLNRLLGEERAMVSDIAGTTRDLIEDVVTIDGVKFRFIDTAGIHETSDSLELMGIDRTMGAIDRAEVIIQVVDINDVSYNKIATSPEQSYILVYNKIDQVDGDIERDADALYISAKDGDGVEGLRTKLSSTVDKERLMHGETIVTNARHYSHLRMSHIHLERTRQSLDHESSDMLSEDLRQVLHELGQITGEITTTDLLHRIFSTFCIGK